MYNSYFRDNNIYSGIVAFARGDVNGDRIPDNVYLTGTKTSESPFIQNITLVIQDGRTKKYAKIPLSDNAGYNPSLFLGDFTGNGVKDILISIATGGSGGIMDYYIYSFLNNIPKLIFDFNVYNEEYKYEVKYKDNYKAEVKSIKNKQRYIIDLTYKGTDYLNEIYNKDGTLKSPIDGWVDPLSGLYPVDFDTNGVYELLAYQKIAGRYHSDSLGYILNSLSFKDNMFVLFNQNVAIDGESI